jgi:hypothetical protein
MMHVGPACRVEFRTFSTHDSKVTDKTLAVIGLLKRNMKNLKAQKANPRISAWTMKDLDIFHAMLTWKREQRRRELLERLKTAHLRFWALLD